MKLINYEMAELVFEPSLCDLEAHSLSTMSGSLQAFRSMSLSDLFLCKLIGFYFSKITLFCILFIIYKYTVINIFP